MPTRARTAPGCKVTRGTVWEDYRLRLGTHVSGVHGWTWAPGHTAHHQMM